MEKVEQKITIGTVIDLGLEVRPGVRFAKVYGIHEKYCMVHPIDSAVESDTIIDIGAVKNYILNFRYSTREE